MPEPMTFIGYETRAGLTVAVFSLDVPRRVRSPYRQGLRTITEDIFSRDGLAEHVKNCKALGLDCEVTEAALRNWPAEQ